MRDDTTHYSIRFADPFADEISFEPNQTNATGFITHKLTQADKKNWVFKPIRILHIMASIVLLLYGFWVFIAIVFLQHPEATNGDLFKSALLGLTFWVCGFSVLYCSGTKFVFDLHTGHYLSRDLFGREKFIACIKDVYALQVIVKKNTNALALNYELNLVMFDTRRITLVDLRNRSQVKKDSVLLAQILSKPLWNTMQDD